MAIFESKHGMTRNLSQVMEAFESESTATAGYNEWVSKSQAQHWHYQNAFERLIETLHKSGKLSDSELLVVTDTRDKFHAIDENIS